MTDDQADRERAQIRPPDAISRTVWGAEAAFTPIPGRKRKHNKQKNLKIFSIVLSRGKAVRLIKEQGGETFCCEIILNSLCGEDVLRAAIFVTAFEVCCESK